MIIEYASVFDADKAHRIIEKFTNRKIKRDHKLGSLKFEIPDEYYFLIKGVDHYHITLEKDKTNKIEFE